MTSVAGESDDGGGACTGVQEWPDGSRYEGEFVDGLKHGSGKYSWRNGEFYEGSFYKDYKHGSAVYYWPTGHKFIGKFYLNRREGCGQQLFPDGTVFQGLYYFDDRFGPGVVSYPDGCQDVGLWVGRRLLRLCTAVEEAFSLKDLPQYASYIDAASSTDSLTQTHTRTQPKVCSDIDERFILPPGIEHYCTDGDHLPLPPGRRRQLDQLFYGELWEPDAQIYQGYERDPLAALPLEARMQAHIHRHRLQAEHVDWNMAAVLSLSREGFGPKGPVEAASELLIQGAAQGDRQAVSQLFQSGIVHPDIGDSRGYTALLAATVNCRNDVIHLLLDMGADIDKLNCEGMSALAVCLVLYYPFHSLNTSLAQPHSKPQDLKSERGDSPCGTGTPGPSSSPESANTSLSSGTGQMSDQTAAETVYLEEEEDRNETQREEASRQKENNEAEETKVVDKHDQMWQNAEGHGRSRGDVEHREEVEDGADIEEPEEERAIVVLDSHIPLGQVQWKGRDKTAARRQVKNQELSQNEDFDSARSVRSYEIQVTEEMMQRSAEALSRTGMPLRSDTQETVHKMAAMKIEHRVRLNTLKLLLQRGADPNASKVPMPVLCLAVMAADAEVVRELLLCGARTDVPLPPGGLYPLHVAASLPGPAGPRITELLLHAITDPDVQTCSQEELYQPHHVSLKPEEPLDNNTSPHVGGGGRTALHIACQRDSDYFNASKVVALLLSHRARTDLLCGSGHSPLSLAIASGNDLAVEELLRGGADPNIPLGPQVGSALCALSNINYRLDGNRAKLLDMLAKAGADIMMPIRVGDVVGTAVDFAHYSFSQDLHIANTPFHALTMREREIFKTRHQLLGMMADLLRQTAAQREREYVERASLKSGASSPDESLLGCESPPHVTEKLRRPVLKFCYHCGRSLSVKLTACSRCHRVFFCSRTCTLKAWNERHKEECVRVSASADGTKKTAVRANPQRDPTSMAKSKTVPRPSSVTVKSQRGTEEGEENVWDSQLKLSENYSLN